MRNVPSCSELNLKILLLGWRPDSSRLDDRRVRGAVFVRVRCMGPKLLTPWPCGMRTVSICRTQWTCMPHAQVCPLTCQTTVCEAGVGPIARIPNTLGWLESNKRNRSNQDGISTLTCSTGRIGRIMSNHPGLTCSICISRSVLTAYSSVAGIPSHDPTEHTSILQIGMMELKSCSTAQLCCLDVWSQLTDIQYPDGSLLAA